LSKRYFRTGEHETKHQRLRLKGLLKQALRNDWSTNNIIIIVVVVFNVVVFQCADALCSPIPLRFPRFYSHRKCNAIAVSDASKKKKKPALFNALLETLYVPQHNFHHIWMSIQWDPRFYFRVRIKEAVDLISCFLPVCFSSNMELTCRCRPSNVLIFIHSKICVRCEREQ
jgi:hypothetical protein